MYVVFFFGLWYYIKNNKENAMKNFNAEKKLFFEKLSEFVNTLTLHIADNDEWTIRGFIDIFRNVYSVSSDTKIVSKLLEIHLFPLFLEFAEKEGYKLELAKHQNWYPDLTFISKKNSDIKFAVDLKTTYRDDKYEGFCNGFTLGSHGEYFINRESSKNIQYPYNHYSGHFCVGIIYSRKEIDKYEELKKYSVDQIDDIPAVIGNFIFFAQEKWKIASDKGGSGNTANIGSIHKIEDILNGNGVFSKAGEEYFDDYWKNYGKILITTRDEKSKNMTSFNEYIEYRGLPGSFYNPKATKKKGK